VFLFPLGISEVFYSHFDSTRDRKRGGKKRRKLGKNKIKNKGRERK